MRQNPYAFIKNHSLNSDLFRASDMYSILSPETGQRLAAAGQVSHVIRRVDNQYTDHGLYLYHHSAFHSPCAVLNKLHELSNTLVLNRLCAR